MVTGLPLFREKWFYGSTLSLLGQDDACRRNVRTPRLHDRCDDHADERDAWLGSFRCRSGHRCACYDDGADDFFHDFSSSFVCGCGRETPLDREQHYHIYYFLQGVPVKTSLYIKQNTPLGVFCYFFASLKTTCFRSFLEYLRSSSLRVTFFLFLVV